MAGTGRSGLFDDLIPARAPRGREPSGLFDDLVPSSSPPEARTNAASDLAAQVLAAPAKMVTTYGEGAARLGSRVFKKLSGDKTLNVLDRAANRLRTLREGISEDLAPESTTARVGGAVADIGTNLVPFMASGGAMGLPAAAAVSAALTGVQSQAGRDASTTGMVADLTGADWLQRIAADPTLRTITDMGVDLAASGVGAGISKGLKARAAAKAAEQQTALERAADVVRREQTAAQDAARADALQKLDETKRAAAEAARARAARKVARTEALAKLDETKLDARHAALERDALKGKPRALLPPGPDEATAYDVETYQLNRDANAGKRDALRAEWEAKQERAALQAPELPGVRNADGVLARDLSDVPTEDLRNEIARLTEAHAADEAVLASTDTPQFETWRNLPDKERLGRSTRTTDEFGNRIKRQQEDLPDADGTMDPDQLAALRKAEGDVRRRTMVRQAQEKSIARLEAEIARRGEGADATAFDFGANVAEAPTPARPVTAETMLAVGKQRAAELESGIAPRSAPDLRPAMEREGRMFGDLPPSGVMFDVGGAITHAVQSRAGQSAVMGATGAGLQQSDDEKIKATGTGLMALAAIHAVGLPRIKAGAGFVGKEVVERMKQSPLGVKVLNGMSHDILADPEVKTLFSAYQDAVAKGRARAAELSKAAKALGPSGDRAVSDAIEREAFEPLTGDQTAVLAVAQRISDEFTALGRGKVEAGLLAPATVAKREGQYLPRVYAEHLGESATDAAERVVKQTTRKPRIVGDKARLDDLSDAARNALGEVREASFRTAYGLDKGYRDIAAAKLFAGLREMPGVVHPEFASAADALLAARTSGDAGAIRAAKQQLEGIAKTLERAGEGYKRLPDTPGMGILRGAVVRADVAAYMDGIPAWGGKMGDLYTFWKRVHTVMNPGTHVGNTMSNSVVAHMSGLPVWQQPVALKRALADYNAYGPTTKYLAELGILERGLPTIADAVPVGGRKMSTALTELSETTRPETKRALAEHGITPRGKLRKGFDKVSQKMEAAYSKEDGVFRVATFNRLVSDGMEPRAAADYVDRAFVNYQTRSPLLGAIKNTVSPFILYPAKAIPFVAGQIVEHPWRWATLAAAWGAMDQYSQKKVGEIAQSDLRPDQRLNKRLGYLVPGFTQLPFTNEKGDRYGIDVARWTPFSALTGAPAPGSTAMALGGADVPAILQPSGPFLDIGARVVNTDPFTGQKLVKPGDDFMDKAATVVKGAASLALPSAASFHLPRVVGDLRNADPKAAAIDALGFVGAKPSVVRPGAQRTREQREYAAARANILGDLRYDLQRAKSPERKRALEARAREKLLRLAGPMQELAGRK